MGALFLCSFALNVVLVKHYNLIDKLIIRNTDLYASYNTVYYRGFVSKIGFRISEYQLLMRDCLAARTEAVRIGVKHIGQFSGKL